MLLTERSRNITSYDDLAGLAVYGYMYSAKYTGDESSKKIRDQLRLNAYGNVLSAAAAGCYAPGGASPRCC
jgi:hypothetical protein